MANRRMKVMKNWLFEYDEEETMELFRQEGIEEGILKCTITVLSDLVHDGLITEEIAAEQANVSVEEFRKLAAQYL